MCACVCVCVCVCVRVCVKVRKRGEGLGQFPSTWVDILNEWDQLEDGNVVGEMTLWGKRMKQGQRQQGTEKLSWGTLAADNYLL